VADGIERAIAQAKIAAGSRDATVVGGASAAQQSLRPGLVDELQFGVLPVLLGACLRLFEGLGDREIRLERLGVLESGPRTELRFAVVR